MQNRSCFRSALLKFICPLLIISSALLNSSIAFAEETYVFERMWPSLQQPWYFSQPYGLAVDQNDNLYLLDSGNHRIQKFNNNGQLISILGRNGTKDGEFSWPSAITVDIDGNIYVYDSQNSRMQKFNKNGEFLLKWIYSGGGSGEGMAADGIGNVFITDSITNKIHKYSSQGELISSWSTHPNPYGIDIDKEGFIYLTASGESFASPAIQKFSSAGELILSWGAKGDEDGEFSLPTGIAVDSAGFVYVADFGKHQIQKFNAVGEFISKWGSKGTAQGEFFEPRHIDLDSKGFLYVSDYRNSRIQKFSTDGDFIASWQSQGSLPGHFYRPRGIDLDQEGNAYILDSANFRVQKISPQGTFLLEWGKLGTANGEFGGGFDYHLEAGPSGIAVDKAGYVYVADTQNDRIQKFDLNGNYILEWNVSIVDNVNVDKNGDVYVIEGHTVAKYNGQGSLIGTWGQYGTTDGDFFHPAAIGVDELYIYVVDTNNHRVQKFNANGEFILKWGSEGRGPGQFDRPMAIAVDNDGNVFVYDESNDWTESFARIQKFTSDGQFIAEFGKFGSNMGQFNNIRGLAVDSSGRLYVSEAGNNRIQVLRESTALGDKAIIVAGGGPFPGNNLWDSTQTCANFAYRTLTYQGFTKQSINYLSSDTDLDLDANGEFDDVDGDATNENLQNAVTNWASDAYNVILYMVDHGGDGTFRMSGLENLQASDLDVWLDQLQMLISGKVIFLYDACESGSFINIMSPPEEKERIVITSTSQGERAYFISKGSISFSNFIWTNIFNGTTLKDAFDLSSQAVSQTTGFQHPLLDDDADALGNGTGDGVLSAATFIGNGTQVIGAAPEIGSVSPDQTITDTNSASLYADGVTDTDGIARVWAVIKPPDYLQGTTSNPVQELPSLDLIPVGNNRYEVTYDNFSIPGTYYIAIYARDRIGNTAVPVLTTISVNSPLRQKAIIIAGAEEDLADSKTVSDSAAFSYRALQFQGYTDDSIFLMSQGGIEGLPVDGPATLVQLDTVMSGWAKAEAQDLLIYLVGAGGYKRFQINATEQLTSQALKLLLDDVHSTIPGRVILIYDAPESGSFLGDLSLQVDKERVLITSTSAGQEAFFLADGSVSFSRFFWARILNGTPLYDAFIHAKQATRYVFKDQVPQFDANGNGIGNEKIDWSTARYYTIGSGIMLAGDDPLLGVVSPPQELHNGIEAPIWVENIIASGTILRVWAVVTPPDASSSPWIVEMPFNASTGSYEGMATGLTIFGTYTVGVYAEDGNGNVSMPAVSSISQSIGLDIYEDDDTPKRASVIVINAIEAQRHNFHDEGDFDWIRFYGIAGESYEIKTENLGSRCDTVIDLFDDKQNLIERRDNYIYAEGELLSWQCDKNGVYYVKITNNSAQDYGSDTGYDLRVYHPVGGSSGMVIGQVTNIFGDPVSGAIVKSDIGGCSAITLPNGYFLMDLPVGIHTIHAEAAGFGLLTYSAVEVGHENDLTLMFAFPSTSIADIDGDGKTNLADVILSLKVLSGMNLTGSIRSDFVGSTADIGQNNTIGLEEAVYIMQTISGQR